MTRPSLASLTGSALALALALGACSDNSDATGADEPAKDAFAAAQMEDNGTSDEIGANFTDREGYEAEETASRAEASRNGDTLDIELPDGVTQEMLGERSARMIAAQVMLDRGTHSPGVIDGLGGANTERAIRYYRKANDLGDGGKVDDALLNALFDEVGGDVFRTYTVTEKDAGTEFSDVPDGFEAMSKVDALGYESPLEMLAERFHMDQDFLKALNPDADFGKAGTKLTIVSHGNRDFGSDIARIEVRKAEKAVVALDEDGKVLASSPATIGSGQFPSPSGSMTVSAIAMKPNYTFDPDSQEWGPDKKFILPPGPNNPVGGTWIDLGKNGYGIHGSPDPQMVAKRASHGCVRLTNWDVAELARAVSNGTPVEFV